MGDLEIEAMSSVAASLAGLDADAQGRVLRWAAERYGVTIPKGNSGGSIVDSRESAGPDLARENLTEQQPSFDHFAELFAKANPRSAADKALLAAYWLQVHEGQSTWQSRRLSTELKHLGHPLLNITQALTANMNRKPQLIIQLKKAGSSKQANKTYKVTGEGIKHVEAMLGRSA